MMNTYIKTTMTATEARLTEQAQRDGHGKRWVQNRMTAKGAELKQIEAAADISQINIVVEWKKSAMWGSNPTANVQISFKGGTCKTYIGKASGCGYDKESAAIGQALNACQSMQKALIIASEKEALPYGAVVNEYGASFSGGSGVSSFRNVFEFMGFTWECCATGKSFDAYRIIREA